MSLAGRTILVTRPEGQAQGLATRLDDMGAIVYLAPAIEIQPIEDPAELDQCLRQLDRFDWLVLTSVNGVDAVSRRLAALGIGAEVLAARVAVIGPATNAALKALRGHPADLCPDEFVAEAIARELGAVQGLRILLARADLARPDLARALRAGGAEVTEVVAYRIVPAREFPLPGACPDYVTVTSATSGIEVVRRFREAGLEQWLKRTRIIAIGPIAAKAMEDAGYPPASVASRYDEEGLIEALVKDAEALQHV